MTKNYIFCLKPPASIELRNTNTVIKRILRVRNERPALATVMLHRRRHSQAILEARLCRSSLPHLQPNTVVRGILGIQIWHSIPDIKGYFSIRHSISHQRDGCIVYQSNSIQRDLIVRSKLCLRTRKSLESLCRRITIENCIPFGLVPLLSEWRRV